MSEDSPKTPTSPSEIAFAELISGGKEGFNRSLSDKVCAVLEDSVIEKEFLENRESPWFQSVTQEQFREFVKKSKPFMLFGKQSHDVVGSVVERFGKAGDGLLWIIRKSLEKETPEWIRTELTRFQRTLTHDLEIRLRRLMVKEAWGRGLDLPGKRHHFASRVRHFERTAPEGLCFQAAQAILKSLEVEIEDQLILVRTRKELGLDNSAAEEKIPPLIDALNRASTRQAILLLDELLPGFRDGEVQDGESIRVKGVSRAIFLSLISNKNFGTAKKELSKLRSDLSWEWGVDEGYAKDRKWASKMARDLTASVTK